MVELIVTLASVAISLALLIFAVDWRYFRDWVVVYLFKVQLSSIINEAATNKHWLEYPSRILPQYFHVSILFDAFIFPVLCILYNQTTREKGLAGILGYALLYAGGMTLVEYPLEKYTILIKYVHWSPMVSFFTLAGTFLFSRAFIAFYRWGTRYFGQPDAG